MARQPEGCGRISGGGDECTDTSLCPDCEEAGMQREQDLREDREAGYAFADAVGSGGDR